MTELSYDINHNSTQQGEWFDYNRIMKCYTPFQTLFMILCSILMLIIVGAVLYIIDFNAPFPVSALLGGASAISGQMIGEAIVDKWVNK